MAVALSGVFAIAILTLWVPSDWPASIFEVAIFILCAMAMAHWRFGSPAFSYPMVPLFWAVGWGLFQCWSGQTLYGFETRRAVLQWASLLGVFLTATILFRDRLVRVWFRGAMLWFGFLISLLAILQSSSSNGKVFWIFSSGYTRFVMGPIVYHNHYAVFIEVVLPMALFEAFRRPRDSLLYAGIAATLYASVIASASRAGVVLTTAEVIAVPTLLWVSGQIDLRTLRVPLLKVAGLLVLFSSIAGWQEVRTRSLAPDPYGGRRELAVSTLHMIAERPWVGFGLGTWPVTYPQYASIDLGLVANRAHSDWLEWTAEGGIPFGLAMASLFIWCLSPALRTVWGLGVVAVFLHAAVDYPFSRPALGSWPILVVAMFSRLNKSSREEDVTEMR